MIVKPLQIGFLQQVSCVRGQNSLWITALGAFNLLSPGDFLPEAQLWQTAAPALGTTPLDAGLPKPRAEVLVAGDVCAPNNTPTCSLVINLELGPIQKRVIAFGQRWWQRGPDGPAMTAPEPFERVRLGWENAFGGPDFSENPLGKGADARKLMREQVPTELPQIETPGALILDIDHHPSPAGLGPLAADAPTRRRFAGTYDDAYLRDDFPNFATDFDWRYCNTACPDQQTGTELRGDEPYRITAMHPDHPEICGHLPGFCVRGFARQGEAFAEVPMRCDTVWLFPNAGMGIVLFRGGIDVADKEASDVAHVLLAYERLTDDRRTLAHYKTAMDERTDPELAAQKMFDQKPLKPERLPEEDAAIEAERQAIIEERDKRQEQAQEHAIASAFRQAGMPTPPAGLFKNDHTMPIAIPVITPSEIRRMEVDVSAILRATDQLQAYAEKQERKIKAQAQQEVVRAASQMQTLENLDPQNKKLAKDKLDKVLNDLGGKQGKNIDIPSTTPHGTAPFSGSPMMQQSFKQAQESIKRQASEKNIKAQSEQAMSPALHTARNRALRIRDDQDPFSQALAGLDRAADEQKKANAEIKKKSGTPTPQAGNPFQTALQALGSKEWVNNAEAQKGADKAREALADPRVEFLSDAIASADSNKAADPEKTIDEARDKIENAREDMETLEADGRRLSPEPLFPQEPLSKEDARALGVLALDLARRNKGLQGRDLAGVDLTGADLSGLDLSGIFLEQAVLKGARLTGANLTKAVFTKADLTEADLSGADLTDSNLSGANLTDACLREARIENTLLYQSRFDRADLSRARLTQVNAIEASLVDVCLSEAEIRDTNFIKCDLSGFSLNGANLHTVTFLDTHLTGLSARKARFERCALVGLDGENADLTGMEFIKSVCPGGAKLNHALMAGLVAPESGWRGADLTGADLTGARLDGADMGDTILVNTCLHRASLKRAILHKANATEANFFGATLYEAQAQDADFTGASFYKANLYSADLTDAVFTLCDFTGANLTLTAMTRPTHVDD